MKHVDDAHSERDIGRSRQSPTQARTTDLMSILLGHWASAAVGALVKLGIPDILDGKALTADELAGQCDAQPDPVQRLLRYSVALDLLTGDDDRYRLAPLGELLTTSHPHSLAPLAELYNEQYFLDAWGELATGIQTGQTPFRHAHNTAVFDYLDEYPNLRETYNSGIAVGSRFVARVPSAIDFSDAGTVTDIGGGDGTLLAAVLHSSPDTRGILLEQASALEATSDECARLIDAGRVAPAVGDFFDAVPHGSDVYLLCRILHNWDDESARRLLTNCRAALAPGARLIIIERVMDDGNPSVLTTAFDVHMMVMTTGRERTLREYTDLLSDAGLTLRDQIDLPMEMSALVVEAAA